MIVNLIKRFRRVITYGFVGIINTAVDFIVFTAFTSFLHFPINVNQAAGYSAGIISSFLLNRSLTFKKGSTTKIYQQIIRFLAVNGVSLYVSMLLISWFEAIGINDYAAKIIVTAITTCINYIGYKLFVFMIKEENR